MSFAFLGVVNISRAKKYFINALVLSGASIILRAISVSFNAHISTLIGPTGMGLITLCSGVFGFAITFACSGINLAIVKLISSDMARGGEKSGSIVRDGVFYSLLFSLTALIILTSSSRIIGGHILGDERLIPCIRIFAFSLPAISLSSVLNGYFCAVRRSFKNVFVQFAEQGVKLIAISYLLSLLLPSGISGSCVAVVLGGVIGEIGSLIISVILFCFDRKKHPFYSEKEENNAHRGAFKSICSVSLPVAISAYVRSALSTAEHLAIPWGLKKYGLDFDKAISSYGVLHAMAVPILLFPSAILGAFSSLLIPELSEAHACGDTRRIRRIVSRVFALSLLFSVGVSGIFSAYSREIGFLLYKNHEVGVYIHTLAPLIPLMYLDGAVDSMLKGLGEHLYTMRVNISDSIISILLILFLLPRGGIMGYVCVIFITEVINTSFSIIKLLEITKAKTPLKKWIFSPLLSIILSTLIVRFLFDFKIMNFFFGIVNGGRVFVFAEVLLTAFFYIIISYLTGGISKEDVYPFKKMILNLRKRRKAL